MNRRVMAAVAAVALIAAACSGSDEGGDAGVVDAYRRHGDAFLEDVSGVRRDAAGHAGTRILAGRGAQHSLGAEASLAKIGA